MPRRRAFEVHADSIRTRCTSPAREVPREGGVYVYCTCVRQATSTRVARELQQMLEGKDVHVAVIRGGLRAWTKAGLPLEAVPREEMEALPVFE